MRKLIFLFGFFPIISCGRSSEEPEESEYTTTIDSLENEILELKKANDTLSDHLMQRAFVTKTYPSYFDSIENPEEAILEKLETHPSLIPKDAVLGGTMRFSTVEFINDELILASYEDGHVMGKTLYSYRVKRNGELEFSLISTVE